MIFAWVYVAGHLLGRLPGGYAGIKACHADIVRMSRQPPLFGPGEAISLVCSARVGQLPES